MELADMLKVLEILGAKKEEVKPDNGPWVVGKKYFIRTVTMYHTGELVSVSPQELVLKDAAWIADSGRFHEAVRDVSKCKEVEPFADNAIIGRGSIVDATIVSDTITTAK